MTRAVKRHPFVTLIAALLGFGAFALVWLPRTDVGAATDGPPSIMVSTVVIQAPVSGGSAQVNGYVNGTAPVTIWARSVTRDNLLNNGVPQWGNPLSYVPNTPGYPGSFYGYVSAGYGDLIEVKAQNYYYNQLNTDIDQVGYVPAGTDTAPPEFNVDTGYIARSYSSGTFSLTVQAYYGLYDPSYPITLTLYEEDNPANKMTKIITSTSNYPQTVSVNVPSLERVRLHATDNFGNGQSLLYYASSYTWAPSATGSFTSEPAAAASERAGSNPVGGVGVLLHNGSYKHETELLHIAGRVLELPINGIYRSRVAYDGPLGSKWDSILNSRVSVNAQTNDITWRPGNGRAELFAFYADSGIYWRTPTGLAVRLTGAAGVYTITTFAGLSLVYENNWLKRIQDSHGNKIEFLRTSQGAVFKIIDDLGRSYQVYYYDHNRIAEIVDFTGRSVMFDYDTGGKLIKIIDTANLTRRFDYTIGMSKVYDRNDRAILENTYATSGPDVNKVVSQKVPSGAQAAYVFDYTQSATGVVSVTDPNGTVRRYAFDVANAYLATGTRVLSNAALRATVSNYDWAAAPSWVEGRTEYDLLNYLPKRNWTAWCPTGTCTGGAGVEKTPYVWFDYNSGVQNSSSVDPRTFAELRFKRIDRDLGDEARAWPSRRESWSYTAEHKVSNHWEERAWRHAPPTEGNNPPPWSLDDRFMTSYGYYPSGALAETIYPDVTTQPETQENIRETYTYNTYGQILTHQQPNEPTDPNDPAVITRFSYYSYGIQKGMLERRWIDLPAPAADPSDTLEYDALGRLLVRTDGRGGRWVTTYDGLDRVATETTPYHSALGLLTTTYVYVGEDLTELRKRNKDYNGSVPANEPIELKTRYEYSPTSGARTKVIRDVKKNTSQSPITQETVYEHDAVFNVTRVKEQFSATGYKISERFVDEFNRAVRDIDYLSDPQEATPPGITNDAVTDTHFSPTGTVTMTEDANGLLTTYSYDGYDRLRVTGHPDGVFDKREYEDDEDTNPLDPVLNLHPFRRYSYVLEGAVEKRISQDEVFRDEIGREFLARMYYDLGSVPQFFERKTFFYKSGREWKQFDEFTKDSTQFYLYGYDGAGRVKASRSPGPPGQEAVTQTFSYDANGNVTTVNVTEWNQAGGAGDPPPGSATSYSISYQYDSFDQRTAVTQGGQTRSYSRDSHGRLKKEAFSTLGIETRTFYDLAGNVEEVWEKVDGVPTWKKVKYTTDYLGRKLSMTTANPKNDPLNPEVTTSYVRDSFGQGRLERVDLPAVGGPIDSYEYEYDLGGRTVLSVDPNGTQIEHVYDPAKGYLDYVNVFYPGYPGPVPGWFSGPRGYGAVDYGYGGLTGCTCSGGRKATEIITRADGQELTRVTRTFDPLGRLLTDTVKIGTPQQTASYAYIYNDPANYQESTIYPGGKVATRVYDSNGRIANVATDMFVSPPNPPEVVASYKYQGSRSRKPTWSEYLSSAGNYSARNLVTYDPNGLGLKTINTWAKREGLGAYQVFADWTATYDAGNRVATKRLGSLMAPMQFTYSRDLVGRLTGADYHNVGSPPPAPSQLFDWSYQAYNWDAAGNVNSLQQCYTNDQATETCEQNGYTLARNERGAVTALTNSRVLGYYTGGYPGAVRATMSPQSRSLNANGDVYAIEVTLAINDNPATQPCSPIPCPANDETATLHYVWTFTYDAWGRMTIATKDVAGSDYEGSWGYVHDYSFTYDGLGRRVRTVIDVTDDTVFLFPDQGKCPIAALRGSGTRDLWSAFDASGNVLQHGTISYLFGTDDMPFMAQASPPKVFLTDVEGHAGGILDCETGDELDKHDTTSCGDTHQNNSEQGHLDFNIYGNSYGLYVEGVQLVEDVNCGPMLLQGEGEAVNTETKEVPKKAGDSGNAPPSGKKLYFEFNAFINKRLGTWIRQPMQSPIHNGYEFKTDERDFGDKGTSRLYTYLKFDSTLVGHALDTTAYKNLENKTVSDATQRRFRTATSVSLPEVKTSVPRWKVIAFDTQDCKSQIEISASGQYPFIGRLAPNIDYNLTVVLEQLGKHKLKISGSGHHNQFPDYEAVLEVGDDAKRQVIYKFASSDKGPGIINLNAGQSVRFEETIDATNSAICNKRG